MAGAWIAPAEQGRAIILAPLFGVLILSLAYDRGPLAKLLGTRTLVYGGQISYCVYMVHEIMYSACGVLMPRARFQHAGLNVRVAVVTAHLAATVIAAAFLYRVVEVPGRRWLRSFGPSPASTQ